MFGLKFSVLCFQFGQGVVVSQFLSRAVKYGIDFVDPSYREGLVSLHEILDGLIFGPSDLLSLGCIGTS